MVRTPEAALLHLRFVCAAFYIFLATILTFFAGFAVIGYVRPKTNFANIMAVGGGLGMVRFLIDFVELRC